MRSVKIPFIMVPRSQPTMTAGTVISSSRFLPSHISKFPLTSQGFLLYRKFPHVSKASSCISSFLSYLKILVFSPYPAYKVVGFTYILLSQPLHGLIMADHVQEVRRRLQEAVAKSQKKLDIVLLVIIDKLFKDKAERETLGQFSSHY